MSSSVPSSDQADSGKLLLRALHGETVERVPLWLMRQAGRYLPEYRKVRAGAGSFLNLCYNPELAEEVTLQPIRRFGFDAAILFSDILVVPDAMGQKVAFKEGEGPQLEPITHVDAVRKLNAEVTEHLTPVYETVRRLRKSLPKETTLIGFAGSPWTVATYMVGGAGSSDQAAAKSWAYRAPDEFQLLIDRLVAATIEHLSAQVEAGAEVLQLFDTWAGSLPEAYFHRFSIAPAKSIVSVLRQRFPEVPVIGFPRGAGVLAMDYFLQTGVQGLSIDTAQSLSFAREVLQPVGCVQGNLDPLLLVAGGEGMRRGVGNILSELGGHPFIFNLGHGIVPQTPPEHVAELVQLVRNFKA